MFSPFCGSGSADFWRTVDLCASFPFYGFKCRIFQERREMMKKTISLSVLTSVMLTMSPARADFIGELDLGPDGCEQMAKCTLGSDFGFIDPRGIGWKADKGYVTNGASTPRWAQAFVGVPFEASALPAVVLHDYYSKYEGRPVRGWLQTQRMFYDALSEGGVGELRSSIMYASVLVGSGKWITRMKGKKCDVGVDCVNQTVEISIETKDESYGSQNFNQTIVDIQDQIQGGIVGREEVERLVQLALPDDIFMQNPSGVIAEGDFITPGITE